MGIRQRYWVAGILEGEGWFRPKSPRKPARVAMTSTDEDVIRKIHRYVGAGNVHGPYRNKKRPQDKPLWHWRLQTEKEAITLMRSLLPLMSVRRKKQISGGVGLVPR